MAEHVQPVRLRLSRAKRFNLQAHSQCGPIRCEIGEDHRAHRSCPCDCGGTLFDWGCGWDDRIIPISWRCNRCPGAFVEYVTNERLMQIRTSSRKAAGRLLEGRTHDATPAPSQPAPARTESAS